MSDALKKSAAQAAMEFISPGVVLGVGTGSTVNHFIDFLPPLRKKIEVAVASSEATRQRLDAAGIPCVNFNEVGEIALYVDGADEIDGNLQMIKGGGGALAREKILAAAAKQFICIADESKRVGQLGRFPLPVEVIPMARSFVARRLAVLGDPSWREGFITDNGNWILDVSNLRILNAVQMENEFAQIPGLVESGIFARRPADLAIVAGGGGVEILKK